MISSPLQGHVTNTQHDLIIMAKISNQNKKWKDILFEIYCALIKWIMNKFDWDVYVWFTKNDNELSIIVLFHPLDLSLQLKFDLSCKCDRLPSVNLKMILRTNHHSFIEIWWSRWSANTVTYVLQHFWCLSYGHNSIVLHPFVSKNQTTIRSRRRFRGFGSWNGVTIPFKDIPWYNGVRGVFEL